MELNLIEALGKLSDPRYGSLDGLRNLASQVSVKVPGAASDAVTLLYSGGLQPDGIGGTVSMGSGGPQAWQLAKPIADVSGNKVIVIDKTPAAEFLNDPRFIDKLNSILNPTGSMGDAELTAARNNALFGTVENGIRTEGFFDDTSRRLVQSAPGDIKTLSPFANGTSTFTQVELREILIGTNSNIQNIDGIPKEQYVRLYNDTLTRTGNATQALEDVRAAVSAKSWVNALELEYRVGTSYAVEVGTGKFFADSPQISSHVIADGIPRTSVGGLMETMSPSQWNSLRAGELALNRGSSLTAALDVGGRYLNKMGVAGALLGLAITANDANAAYAEGDTAKAKQILGDWALDFAGGMAGGLLAAELMGSALAPLYLTGPAGAIIAGGLTLMAGVFGGVAGEHYVHSFADAISNLVNSLTTSALNWVAPRRDPLVLDLDGNGITTSGINPLAPILFDQDGDGTKTATGWIASGEAIVVRDLNGNGTVDSGRELFGDNTILTQGPRVGQTAANGFEALADLDSNADGKFDANDAAFASVKLWKDANQNGISEAGELFTFADLGVASINTSGTATNINLGGGNTQTHSGSFTKVGGAVGSAGTAELAGSLLLANNNFYREFTDDPAITSAAQALPQMQGSGLVRDLRPAMSLGNAQAADLQAKLSEFAADTTRAAQMAHLDALVQSWGATSAMTTSLPSGFIDTNGDQRLTAIWQYSQSNPAMYAKITALEQFNGQTILDKWVRPSGSGFVVSYSAPQETFINQAYDALKDSVYGALVVQTRLKPYLDSIGLVVDETGVRFDTTATIALVQSKVGTDALNTVADLIDLHRYAGDTTKTAGWEPYQTLETVLETTAITPAMQALLTAEQLVSIGATATSFTVANTTGLSVLGNGLDNTLTSTNGSNVLYGFGGNDLLTANGSTNLLDGGDGDDTLVGNGNINTLLGGAGNDTMTVSRYASGGQVFEGGTGDDVMTGSGYSDTYRFNLGDGRDTINDYDAPQLSDKLVFGQGIAATDIVATRLGNDMVFKHVNGTDQVTVKDWFVGFSYQLETVEFARGTVWTRDALTTQLLTVIGTASNDVLVGTPMDDVLYGGAGDDTLIGLNGNNILRGESGNDTLTVEGGNDNQLYGGEGNDSLTADGGTNLLDGGDGNDTLVGNGISNTLLGGAGNDTMSVGGYNARGGQVFEGGAGDDVMTGSAYDDTYRFNIGDGRDTINNHYQYQQSADRLVFEPGIAVADMVATRVGNDMVFKHVNGVDQVTVKDWFAGYNYQIATVEFAGDAVWTSAALTTQLLTVTGTSGNDVLVGTPMDDVMSGGAGDDTLDSGLGGNNILRGDAGNDALTANGYYNQMYGGDGNDTISAIGGTNLLDGGSGNDTLVATGNINTLLGGAGNDTMSVVNCYSNAVEVFEGGAGDDTMTGSAYADTYRFNLGDGRDTINDNGEARFADKVVFGPGITTADIAATRLGNDMVFKHVNGTDQITIKNWFADVPYQIETVEFSGGALWTSTALTAQLLTTAGTAGNDTLVGTPLDDVLLGGAGDDTLSGLGGNNTLRGEAGNDSLTADGGTNLLDGGDGDDTLVGKGNSNTLLGGSGNDTMSVVGYYTSGGQLFEGGTGDDVMTGSVYNDTYRFNLGDGRDTINDYGAPQFADKLVFGPGIAATDIVASRAGNDMVFKHINGTDQITVKNWFSGVEYQIETVTFVGGTIWDNASLTTAALLVVGTGGDDVLYGTAYGDTLLGLAGEDTLYGGDGDDVLDGGEGDSNWLLGGAGADTYIINQGAAFTQISSGDTSQSTVCNDTLRFGAGISAADASVSRDLYSNEDNSVILSVRGTAIKVMLNEYRRAPLTSQSSAIGRIEFADGTVWDRQIVMTKLATAIEGDETLEAGPGGMTLRGYGGNDTLIAGSLSATVMIGGTGNDSYYITRDTDVITELENEGVDTIHTAFTNFTLEANIENLTFHGSSASIGDGNALDNVMTARDAALNPTDYGDKLWGLDGNDTLIGSHGRDQLNGGTGNDVLIGGDGNDTLIDGEGDDVLLGGNGDDLLIGSDGNDTLNGGDGTDDVSGGVGNDTLIAGARTILGGHANLSGDDGADTYIVEKGCGLVIIRNFDTDALNSNADTLQFGTGIRPEDVTVGFTAEAAWGIVNDAQFTIDSTGDVVIVRDFRLLEDANGSYAVEKIQFEGGVTWSIADVQAKLQAIWNSDKTLVGGGDGMDLVGHGGNDTLDALYGAATMIGGTGNDTYFVRNAGDVVTELVNEGNDTVNAYRTLTLASNVENLTLMETGLTGTGNNLNGTGNTLDNRLIGNSGNNTLNGGAGVDLMFGGAGNDTYVVDNGGDVVTENLNEGTDLVQTSVTYTLGANVENLTLTGTSAINGTGNALNNTLTGNSGANILDGGAGADTMVGGAGNDSYYVDNASDMTTEAASAGTDLVIASLNWTLGTNLENLTLAGGTANINGTGNALANTLRGNSGDNVLNGGTGTDTLIGGAGNDTYILDVATDVVTENANEGTDTVNIGVTYTLGSNVENLTLTGTTAIKGTGNALDNVLIGNSAANVLTGGAGNDTYIVGTGDTTIEAAGAGTDTVQSAIAWTLATNVENLTLTGTSAVNGTGNTADNLLTGNSAVNTLTGNAGNDTLDGKGGADVLIGGAGNDTYWLGRGYGLDSVTENDATAGNTDVARFDATVATDQLWFRKVSNNLEVSIIGTTDKLTLTNWYLGNQYHVEQFKTSNGKTLLDSQVQNLVSAMAAFAPPAAGQTTLPANYATSLNTVIAANWQ